MNRKKIITIILIILAVVVLLAISRTVSQKQASSAASEMILFYGETCPHCKIVEQYLDDNKVRARVKFQELEVYNNKANAALLAKKAKTCNLDTTKGLGVPLFFDGQNCLTGDQEIINFFKTK
jgi:glutaredoxin